MKRPPLWTYLVSIGGCIYGYNIGAMAGVLLIIKQKLSTSPSLLSILASSFFWGTAVAMVFAGILIDKIGRKKIIIFASILIIVASVLSIVSSSIVELSASRFLIGIMVGLSIIAIPVYLSESLPAEHRGKGTVAYQLFVTLGILIATLSSFYFTKVYMWRPIIVLQIFPAAILLVCIIKSPPSPRWKRKKVEENNILKFRKILTQRHVTFSLFLAISFAVFNQLTGINTIIQFDSSILSLAGFTQHETAIIGSVFIVSINFITTILSLYIVDKFERKKMLRFGLLGIVLSLLIASLLPIAHLQNNTHAIILTFCLITFVFFFALAPGAVIWTIITEILPNEIRGWGASISLFIGHITSAALSLFFLPIAHKLGLPSILLFFSITSLIYFLLTFLLPNTTGKKLEEIRL